MVTGGRSHGEGWEEPRCWCSPERWLSPASCVSHSKQGANYREGLTPVLSLLTEGSRHHREIRRYIKTQVNVRVAEGGLRHRPPSDPRSFGVSQKRRLNTKRHVTALYCNM